MFRDWSDIKRDRERPQAVEVTATLRMDRVHLTPNGPVVILRPGENLIELIFRKSGEPDNGMRN